MAGKARLFAFLLLAAQHVYAQDVLVQNAVTKTQAKFTSMFQQNDEKLNSGLQKFTDDSQKNIQESLDKINSYIATHTPTIEEPTCNQQFTEAINTVVLEASADLQNCALEATKIIEPPVKAFTDARTQASAEAEASIRNMADCAKQPVFAVLLCLGRTGFEAALVNARWAVTLTIRAIALVGPAIQASTSCKVCSAAAVNTAIANITTVTSQFTNCAIQ